MIFIFKLHNGYKTLSKNLYVSYYNENETKFFFENHQQSMVENRYKFIYAENILDAFKANPEWIIDYKKENLCLVYDNSNKENGQQIIEEIKDFDKIIDCLIENYGELL
jgi:hypothetical protein